MSTKTAAWSEAARERLEDPMNHKPRVAVRNIADGAA